VSQAREYHQEILGKGFDWLKQGNAVEALSPDITRHLPPRSLEALKRQQDIDLGLRPHVTDFSTALWLGAMPSASFSKRVLLEDQPYLSPISRVIMEGIHTSHNSQNVLEQQKGQAYLSTISKINQAALASGGAMQDPAVLDTLYFQGLKQVDTQLKKYGILTDAQIWHTISPVILAHVDNRINNGDRLQPGPGAKAINTVAAQTGIPADMVMPTWNSLKAQSDAKVSFADLSRHYRQNPAEILSKTLGYPQDSLQPLISDLTASGTPLSLAAIMPQWEKRARSMPAHWF
jgi:hypothetical protein